MQAAELLKHARSILDPALTTHGFAFEPGLIGVGSGGPFAQGAYVRGDRRLEFSVRWSLGEVVYRVGNSLISHEELMRVVAGPRKARYPGFSDDPLDGFRGLRHDLELYGGGFLRGTAEDFHSTVRRAAETRPKSGF